VLELHGHPNEDCLVLPTAQAAGRCRRFLLKALYGADGLDNAFDDGNLSDDQPSSDAKAAAPSPIRVVPVLDGGSSCDVHAVLFPAQTKVGMEAKAYWQHTGEVVTSRRAEQALLGVLPTLPPTSDATSAIPRITAGPQIWHCSSGGVPDEEDGGGCDSDPFDALRSRIGGWANVPSDHVFLAPSGMASIYAALRASRRYRFAAASAPRTPGSAGAGTGTGTGGGGRSIVYGFPYLDTLKLCSRSEFCPDGVEFFGLGNAHDLENLRRMLTSRKKDQQYCALFTEVPSNPLLQCPDLIQLRALADEHDFCLVVDDTISNFLNSDLIDSGLADAVCTSLTKLVSGRGDAIAGSLVANPNTPKGRWLQQDLLRHHEQLRSSANSGPPCRSDPFGLFHADARAVLLNSVDFPERNDRINATAEALADWLHDHADVERVYYPKLAEPFLYQRQVQKGGYGGLMSVTLPPHMCQRTFYDSLDVAKGPSLGTNFTLVCPYTLLAHYHELDFAISCDVPPNLLRISIGLEPFDELKAKFETAFRMSRLHPRVCTERLAAQQQQRRAYSTVPSDRWTAFPPLGLRRVAAGARQWSAST
jgi:cystathionine gamma-synthase